MSELDEFKRIDAPIRDLLEQVHRQLAERGPVREPAAESGPCSRCGGRGYTIRREGAAAVAELCGCDLRCTTCAGRGFVLQKRDGYEFQAPCECRTLARRVAAYNAAQLPARFVESTFETWVATTPELGRIKNAALHFADTARPGHTRRGFGLLGRPGCGKTHLLCATLARLTLARGVQCRYVEIGFLFADLKAAISDPRARATVDKIDELAEVDILAIDELGKGRGSVFEEEVLDELIGRRYNSGKLTLFATNYPLQEKSPQRDEGRQELWHQSLRARVGERVHSRLHEMVVFHEFPASTPDQRNSR